MQGHSAPPATSTTHQLVAQPRKVREGCVTTVFSHRMISRSWSTENGVSPPLNLVMKMMRVHDEGFANHLDHQHAMHSYVPAALQADVPLFTFPANLFRWAWIVFQTRQKRLFNWWCARCGPYPHLVVDVCHGINALRRTTTHEPTEVGRFRPP